MIFRGKLVTLAAVATAAGPLTWGGTSASAAPMTPALFHVTSNIQDVQLLSQKTFPDGNVSALYRIRDNTVTVAALPGATVSFNAVVDTSDGAVRGVQVGVAEPSLDKSNPAQAVAAYKASGRSIQQTAIESGFTPTEAQLAQVQSNKLIQAQPMATGNPSVGVGQIIAGWCVTVTGDAGHAYGHVCDSEKLLQYSGSNWYLGDQLSGTAWDHDWWYSLDDFKGYVTYPSGNTIIQYAPTGSITESSGCVTNTLSFSYVGVGLSSSAQYCPTHYYPIIIGNNGFGEEWKGYTASLDPGIDPIDVDHSPSGYSSTATLTVYIHWS